VPLAGRISEGRGKAGKDQRGAVGLMIPGCKFPQLQPPLQRRRRCVRQRAASNQSGPKTMVLGLAECRGEYGVSIDQVVIIRMSIKMHHLSHFTQ